MSEFDESNANVLERFYTSAGNPVKEILLKLNLPIHMINSQDSKMVVKSYLEVNDVLKARFVKEVFVTTDTERTSRSDEVSHKIQDDKAQDGKTDYAWFDDHTVLKNTSPNTVKIKEQARPKAKITQTSSQRKSSLTS
ncbi:hypothetical protein Tco_0753151 [Tanacetum coccineum]